MNLQDQSDLENIMGRVVAKLLPDVIRNMSSNIYWGTILAIDTNTRFTTIRTKNGEVVSNLKIPRGADGKVGDTCIIISQDTNLSNMSVVIPF